MLVNITYTGKPEATVSIKKNKNKYNIDVDVTCQQMFL